MSATNTSTSTTAMQSRLETLAVSLLLVSIILRISVEPNFRVTRRDHRLTMITDSVRFASGLKNLTDQIHALGLWVFSSRSSLLILLRFDSLFSKAGIVCLSNSIPFSSTYIKLCPAVQRLGLGNLRWISRFFPKRSSGRCDISGMGIWVFEVSLLTSDLHISVLYSHFIHTIELEEFCSRLTYIHSF